MADARTLHYLPLERAAVDKIDCHENELVV